VIVIFVKLIILIDMFKQKILWEIPIASINTMDILDKGIVLYTRPNKKGHTEFLIPTTDKNLAKALFRKISQLLG
jgi:hypothetical protein